MSKRFVTLTALVSSLERHVFSQKLFAFANLNRPATRSVAPLAVALLRLQGRDSSSLRAGFAKIHMYTENQRAKAEKLRSLLRHRRRCLLITAVRSI